MGEAIGCGGYLAADDTRLRHRFTRRCRTERGSGAGEHRPIDANQYGNDEQLGRSTMA